jgi:tRNA nucleotidyltransferase (CCA-adding enzyme)
MGRPPKDLDVAVEGDAPTLARVFARAPGRRLERSSEFGTACVWVGKPPTGFRMDLASTRRESYPHPGALPRVRPAPLSEDLDRRDFTVNAMAMPLHGLPAGTLVDPHGGRRDLAGRVIRMLHARSPSDDPTRALRAIRLARRLGFSIEPATRSWIRQALRGGAFDRLSGDRLRRELELLLAEVSPPDAARALVRLGLHRALCRRLDGSARALRRLDRLEEFRAACPEAMEPAATLAAWSLGLSGRDRRALFERLAMRSPFPAGGPARLARRAQRLASLDAPLSAWAALLKGCRAEAVLAVACALPRRSAKRLLEARAAIDRASLSIRGEDLRRAGVAPGPAIGRALRKTLLARLDGRIGASGEFSFALKEARR